MSPWLRSLLILRPLLCMEGKWKGSLCIFTWCMCVVYRASLVHISIRRSACGLTGVSLTAELFHLSSCSLPQFVFSFWPMQYLSRLKQRVEDTHQVLTGACWCLSDCRVRSPSLHVSTQHQFEFPIHRNFLHTTDAAYGQSRAGFSLSKIWFCILHQFQSQICFHQCIVYCTSSETNPS